jgi:hypothetical protein
MRTNIGEELRRAINGNAICCAYLRLGKDYDDETITFVLPISHTPESLEAYLKNLEKYHYDSGYGGQELYGNVWLANGEWLERGEYDGSEWWRHVKRPNEPAECLDLTGNEAKTE